MKAAGLENKAVENTDSVEVPRDIFFDGPDVNLEVDSAGDVTITIENLGTGTLTLNVDGDISIGDATSTDASSIDVFDGSSSPGQITLYADDGTPH
jgi:hypothetical protein